MKKMLYLVRHGQTMFNRQHRIQGWCDSPLTEVGKSQAKAVKEYFEREGIRFDKAYCSTSERCSDTLELITDMPYRRLKGLKEMFYGELEAERESLGSKDAKECETYYERFGGESSNTVRDRMVSTLTGLMEEEGDCILAVNGKKASSKDELVKMISFCKGEKVRLKLLRDGEEIEVSIKPVRSQEGVYQIGIWVRDDIAGVGTLTYVNGKGEYGALGHGITDADVGSLIDVHNGSIYETTILEIRKGQRGQPGEMSGMINYKDEYKLGTIKENTSVGIYGTLTNMPEELEDAAAVPVAYKESIKKGPAQIISSVEGSRRAYDIEIQQTDYHSEGNNKGIQFQVTDKKLLKNTGGIIQGMSGSPIVQDGKIIGAVTHVFISDSKMGYGIFIENMLEHS